MKPNRNPSEVIGQEDGYARDAMKRVVMQISRVTASPCGLQPTLPATSPEPPQIPCRADGVGQQVSWAPQGANFLRQPGWTCSYHPGCHSS